MAHTCHAIDCHIPVEPKLIMCRKHWKMVPKHLQQSIWYHYRPGQEQDKRPSPEYVVTARQAVNAVAAKEGKPLLPDLTDSPLLPLAQLSLF